MTALALVGFADEAAFRDGLARASRADHRVVGLWTPYPVEIGDLGEAEARPVMWCAILGGLLAAAAFYLFIWWTATQAYRFDSGNRPLHSWQAFLIAPVEFGALAAGIAGVVVFLVKAGLTRLHHPAFDLDEVERASSDRFVVALACDAGADANALLGLMAEAGAVHSRLVAS